MTATLATVLSKRSSDEPCPAAKKTHPLSPPLSLGSFPNLAFELGMDSGLQLPERKAIRKLLYSLVSKPECPVTILNIFSDHTLEESVRLSIILKLASHIFSWKELPPIPNFTLPDPSGFSELVTLPYIICQIEASTDATANLSCEERLWIASSLRSTLFGEILKDKDYPYYIDRMKQEPDTVFTLGSGYNNHIIYIILWGRYLIHCNRGSGCRQSPGIRVYDNPSSDWITEDCLKKIICRIDNSDTDWPHYRWIEKELKLNFLFKILMKSQGMGNCTWASTKALLRAVIAIKKISKNGFFADFQTSYPHYKKMSSAIKRQFLKDVNRLTEEEGSETAKRVLQAVEAKIPVKYQA